MPIRQESEKDREAASSGVAAADPNEADDIVVMFAVDSLKSN